MKKYITIKQLADIYEGTFSESVLRKWSTQGKFTTYNVSGRKKVTTQEDFEAFIESTRVEPVNSIESIEEKKLRLRNKTIGKTNWVRK